MLHGGGPHSSDYIDVVTLHVSANSEDEDMFLGNVGTHQGVYMASQNRTLLLTKEQQCNQ
jgi:hypothetical protein